MHTYIMTYRVHEPISIFYYNIVVKTLFGFKAYESKKSKSIFATIESKDWRCHVTSTV